MLFLFFAFARTTATAQDNSTQTSHNSPVKKSTMQVILIDRFVVPNAVKAQFLERMKISRDFIKTLALSGFIEDSAYEEPGETESHYVTIAVWQDEASIQKARQIVSQEYQKEGFNMPEFIKKLNIQMERGFYKKVEE